MEVPRLRALYRKHGDPYLAPTPGCVEGLLFLQSVEQLRDNRSIWQT